MSSLTQRATELFDATQRALYHPRARLFYEDTGQPPRFAYLWPFITAFGAVLDLLATLAPDRGPDLANDLLASLESYWRPAFLKPSGYASAVQPPLGPGGDLYYDDNAWVGLELLRAARLLDRQRAVERAGRLFDLAVSGWDHNAAHPAPGGVFWVRAAWNRDRGVDCVAPNALLGLALFELTGRSRYLEWSRRMIDWGRQHFRTPDGRYWDKITGDGRIDRTLWSYNQGTMAAAGARLARLTGEQAYLDEARQTAEATLAADEFETQPAPFNAIFFHSLLSEPALPDPRPAAHTYFEQVWNGVEREPSSGLFLLPPPGAARLLDQTALVQVAAAAAAPRAV